MYYILFALFMAFSCPANPHKKQCNGSIVSTNGGIDGEGDDDGGGTGGDGGHIDPDKP